MEADTYTLVKTSIKRLLNIDLTYYKDEQMRRRLDSWLVRCGAPGWPEYFRQLSGDDQELTRFRNYLTINVSEFFRDTERWRTLREAVLPNLLDSARRNTGGSLKIWSAGCSTGQEIYSLTMLLEELTPGKQHQLLASDIDRGALARAQARGPYQADDVRSLSRAQVVSYFEPGGPPYFVKEPLARRVRFREQNLLADAFEPNFDLIVCRNVIIYFTAEAKAQLYPRFQAALRPGGVLFLGGTEIIPHPQQIGLTPMGFSFYVRE